MPINRLNYLIRNQSVEPEMWGRVLGGTRNTSQGELNANLIFNWRKVAHLYCGERPCSTDEGTSQLGLM